MGKIVTVCIAAAAFIGLGAAAQADQFVNTQNNAALEILDQGMPGADKFVFFCWPQDYCSGEKYTTNGKGVSEVTFEFGEKNTIRFWPDGDKAYKLEHIAKATGKVTKMTLKRNGKSEPVSIPNLALFNSKWGAQGTRVTVSDGVVSYCFSSDPCAFGPLVAVGDRIAIADIGDVMKPHWGYLLLGRARTDTGGDFYTVSFHRADGNSYQSPFKIEETTSALK